MLMAKGKFRGSNGSNKALISANSAPKGPDVFTKEFKINETPPRGRGMCDFSGEVIKLEHQNSMNRPSRFTNAPPPLMSLHTGIPSVEKICVGIENAPQGFDLRGRIIGAGGANLLYIRGETGATVTLRGRGSQFIDPVLGSESPEPLHLYIEHPKPEALQNAKQLAINLIQTMQSELQAFIQQQPPPVQPQHVIEAAPIQQIQQAHFQTMNIGTLAQSNVVTIQHQDIIQHPQSSVVTLPATILTATMPGAGGASVPPPGVHIPAQSRPMVPSAQAQELQTIISSPPPVGQVQLIGPPPTMNQVQYQIHSGQPVHIQVPASHASSQPVTQMYVMSQPPPSPNFITSSAPVSGAVSYVYTQSNVQRLATPPQGAIETVNLQQPPPSAPINITHQPPPSLLHLHFPPPNFPRVAAPQQQYVLQSEESVPSHIQQNSEQQHHHHILQSRFEAQPPQFSLHAPPPASQTFIVPNQELSHHPPQPLGIINDRPHEAIDQGPPQPVPPPQIVPHPGGNYIPNSMNIPPPNHQLPPQNAPWFNGQQPGGMAPPQGQFQVQTQVHYSIQSPPHHQFDMRKPELPEDFKGHGVKRRFTDVEPQDAPSFQYGPPHQHGAGRLQKLMHGPSPRGVGHPGTRNKPPPHPGENMEPRTGLNPGNEPTFGGDNSLPLGPPHGQPPPMPWQPLHVRMPWMRPPPAPRDEHHVLYPALPTNMPPPQIRPARGPPHVGSQSPTFDHHVHKESPHSAKAPLYNSYPLMQSICNAPPPPPPPAQPYPVSQGHQQPPVSCPPWMN